MRQVLRAGALGRPRGIRWRGRWEWGLGWGIHVNPWLILVNVWQKPLQYCKVISLQLIKKKKEEASISLLSSSIRGHACWVTSVVSDSVWPHGQQPTKAPLSTGFSRQAYRSGLPFLGRQTENHDHRKLTILITWTTVQFNCSVVSNSLQPLESKHPRPPCPSPTPGVYSNSCPSSRWCHPAISSSVLLHGPQSCLIQWNYEHALKGHPRQMDGSKYLQVVYFWGIVYPIWINLVLTSLLYFYYWTFGCFLPFCILLLFSR